MRALRIFVAIVALFYVVAHWGFQPWRRASSGVLNWDVYGYSFYLSGIIHGDVWQARHLDEIDTLYRPCNDVLGYGRFPVVDSLTGERRGVVYKYTMGNALFMSPFYFSAHAWALVSGRDAPNGYSRAYSQAITIGWWFWSVWGLYLLGCLLLRYFRTEAVLLTLASIALATNYYAYSVQQIGMNHIPLFFCAALGALSADNWARTGRGRDLYLLALMMGLSVLLRPTEAVLVLLLPAVLLLVQRHQGDVWAFVRARWGQLAIGAAVGLATVFPQLLYWKLATGHWLHYSYQGESFDFANPHIYKGLFSYRKGFFVYAPIMFLAVLGLPILFWRWRGLALVLAAYLAANIYVIFSWQAWTYGGSFGARSMIQSMAFWALPMAAFWQAAATPVRRWAAYALAAMRYGVLIFFVWLNIVQTLQYHWAVLHWEYMSRECYWYIFGKIHFTQDELNHIYHLHHYPPDE